MENIKKQTVIAAALALVIGAAGGYAAGEALGEPSSSQGPGVRGGFGEMAGRGGTGDRTSQRFGGNAPVAGEILSMDAQSLTLKLRDGGSRIVFFTPATPVMRMASGTPSDLSVGSNVTVMGTTNPDGSVTASSLQLRPEGGLGGMRIP